MDLQTLADKCREDTLRYKRDATSPTKHCCELLRRALEEDDNQALTHVYINYRQFLMNWVYQHPGFAATGEEADYFMSGAFANFYFGVRHEKFKNFNTLAQTLQYLKACVHSIIMQYTRKHHLPVSSLDEVRAIGMEPDFEHAFRISAIWERIAQLLPDEEDQRLAHLLFAQDRKPAEIATAFPEEYPTARNVSVARQRIVRILRQDETLRGLLGAAPNTPIQ